MGLIVFFLHNLISTIVTLHILDIMMRQTVSF
jgi:hypothetical protein